MARTGIRPRGHWKRPEPSDENQPRGSRPRRPKRYRRSLIIRCGHPSHVISHRDGVVKALRPPIGITIGGLGEIFSVSAKKWMPFEARFRRRDASAYLPNSQARAESS